MPDYWYPTAFSHWGDEERGAVERVMAAGRFTMGEEVDAFEREFAAWHGMRHGVMVNSGSSANLIAAAALFHLAEHPLKRGDWAIVPALAWSTTYAPLVQHGLNLVLADCDDSWNADLYARELQAHDQRLVVSCSILGSPGSLEGWRTGAGVIGARLIEDNCESLGGVTGTGTRCGTSGLMNTFSFFYSHQISAIEGGMVLTDDDECAALCRMLRAHGWTRDVATPRSFDEEYDFRLFGYNVRPLELHAAIAREQLKKLPGFIAARRANVETFRRLSEGLPILHQAFNGEPSPFGLSFTINGGDHGASLTRGALVQCLRSHGIDCRLPTGGSFRLHRYGAPWRDQETPQADAVHTTGLFLGNAPFDIGDKIEKAVEVMRGVLCES